MKSLLMIEPWRYTLCSSPTVHRLDIGVQVIERRKREQPSRPLIRISSTFFWHLSSDYDLESIPALAERSRVIRAAHINLGKDDGEAVVYEPMKVGQQVQK